MMINYQQLPLRETTIRVIFMETDHSGNIGNVVKNMTHFQSDVNKGAKKPAITQKTIKKPGLLMG